MQQPYEWGYQGMKLMAKYLGGRQVVHSRPNTLIIIPTKIIDKTNVDGFWAELKQRTGESEVGIRSDGRSPDNRRSPRRSPLPLRHRRASVRAIRPPQLSDRRHAGAVSRARSHQQDLSRRQALTDVSLAVAPGEVVGLIGENGAGKSTLMKILGGVVAPSTGTIRIDGDESASLTVGEAMAAGIAFVHQELNLFDNLDVAANVFIGREPRWAGRCKLVDRKALHAQVPPLLSASAATSGPTRRSPICRSPSASCSRSPRRCRSTRASSSWTSRPRA